MIMTNAYNRNTGRSDAEQSAIMKVLRRPVFVDNAVVHGEYTKTSKGHQVTPPTKGDFETSHDRTYQLVEEEDGIRLLHNSSYNSAVFYGGRKLITGENTPIFLFAKNQPANRLVPGTIENTTTGSRLTLQNLRGRTLNDIGFTERNIRLGQSIDVGLRTTDLAMRVIDAGGGSVNSARVDKQRHSTSFLSYNFVDAESIASLRFISKHDGQSLRSDRFGNLKYTHQSQTDREHYIGSSAAASVESDNVEHAPNRVTVYGKSRGNNADNVVRVDDLTAQKDGVVNEIPGGVHVPTASTEAAARRIGQRILATARRAKGVERFKDVVKAANVRPGDQIHYDSLRENTRGIVLEAKHDLTESLSEFQISSTLGTLEDVLQRFQEVQLNTDSDSGQSVEQIRTQIVSTGAHVTINPSWVCKKTVVHNNGFLIGHPVRGRIHGDTKNPEATTVRSMRIRLCKNRPQTIARG